MKWEKRILHLGLGRFHRGHQAVYYQKMKDLGDARWGVVSMSMRSPEARDQLKKVDLRYPVLELSAKESKTLWVESIQEALSAHDDLEKVMEAFISPQLEIVTLTITEKGYDLDGNGELDVTKSHIQKDISHPESPETAIGLLALGLRKRRLSGQSALTIISCDNLRDNGKKLRNAVTLFMQKTDWQEDLKWISDKIKFPNTMVDRIVPSLLPEKITQLEKDFSLPSHSEVIGTETFSQWVIEDQFALTRPEWNKVGVQFVSEVRPFEELKLKLLNASHSYLAYAGLLRGHQFVHEAINDPELRSNVLRLYDEVTPILDVPRGYDLTSYKNALIKRFENNKLPHQLKQIAMDGSQKLSQRIFPSLLTTEKNKLPNSALTLAVQEWLQYCSQQLDQNILPDDPENKTMKDLHQQNNWKEGIWNTRIFSTLAPIEALKIKILS